MTSNREGKILLEACIKATRHLAISPSKAGQITGFPEAWFLQQNTIQLPDHLAPTKKAVLFIKIVHLLDQVFAGDNLAAQQWLNSTNSALTGSPIQIANDESGLLRIEALLTTWCEKI